MRRVVSIASPAAGRPDAATTSPDSRATAASLLRARRNRGASWTKRTSGAHRGDHTDDGVTIVTQRSDVPGHQA